MEHNTLPPYMPSLLPHYSTELLPGEQTVESAHRTSSRPLTGVYRRITDRLTIILRNQPPGNIYPIYGRGEVIQGDVIPGNMTDVTSVTLKLEGQVYHYGAGVSVSSVFLSTTHVLWSASDGPRCPRTIPFAVVLPLTFQDDGQTRTLPPTLESAEPHSACLYSLIVELSRPRQFLSFLKGSEAVEVPFVYRPRSRPHLPMLPGDFPFMSTIKSSPEEWHEIICTLPMSRGSGLPHAQCLLFIPSVQTYAFSDKIPFHLQIRGSPTSLMPFLEQGQDGCHDATGQRRAGVNIRVYLLRQTTVRIHGQSATANRNLGEGRMEPSQVLSSKNHASVRHPLGDSLDSLDWDGVLRCDEDVNVPGFFTNQFSVKDFIALSIIPRQPLKSPLLGVTHSCPIRLVTDPYQTVL